MGLRRALRLTEAVDTAPAMQASAASVPLGNTRVGIRSPWATTALSPIVWSDIYAASGVDAPVDRAAALSIPAVARGVSLVSMALASCPLTVWKVDVQQPTPRWMVATDGAVAPQYRMQFTVEDLILYGWSLWMVDRNAAGRIQSADRVRPDLWQLDGLGNVVIGTDIVDPSLYILIKGPQDGILTAGARTLRGAINLELAWQKAVRNPLPATVLQQVGDDQLDDDEIDDLLADWRIARQDPDGAVAYVPANINVQALGAVVPDVLTEARNASAIDIARLIGIPASALDAGAIQTSLTYTNTSVGVGFQLVSQGLKPYADSIAYALSQDNVVPSGQRTALDMTDLMADAANLSRTGSPTED